MTGMVTVWEALLGDAHYLARRRLAGAALAAAFPAMAPSERMAIARRSARLQVRRRRERFAERNAVRLCRDLTLEGEEALQRLRENTPATTAVAFTAAFGAPELAVRAVRLYGGDPDRAVEVLPRPGSGSVTVQVEFLGRGFACPTDWFTPTARLAVPVFALLEPRRRYRVLVRPPLALDGDPGAATREALASIEREVRRRPEAWVWGETPRARG